MNKRNSVEVVINNRIYTICGVESEEYIQKIASYINAKHAEFKTVQGYNNLSVDLRTILMEINIADDYFKVKKQGQDFLMENEKKVKELMEAKQELITCQTEHDVLKKDFKQLKEDFTQAQEQVAFLEAELAKLRKK